jgi:hypothetical protein
MVEHTRDYRSYDPDIDMDDEGLTDRRPIVRYRFGRSDRPDSYSHDSSVPLFLSDGDGEPHPDEYMMPEPGTEIRRIPISTRILAGVLVAAAAAILFALVTSDFTRDLIADAKASIPATFTASSAAAQPEPTKLTANDIQLKDPARLAAPFNQTVGARSVATLAVAPPAEGPSRADITSAYQNALQGRTPAAVAPTAVAPAAVAPAPVASSVRKLDADELATLMNRAKSLLAAGDIAPARLLLERAADAQEASAALMLAQTYDPGVLGAQDLRSITPDPAMARSWYEKAARMGSSDAQQRLAQMQN